MDIDDRSPVWAPAPGSTTTAQRGALPSMREGEYEAIAAAVMETARGRWFLGEFARRNRAAETGPLLEALARLERAVAADRETRDLDRLRSDLLEMAATITLTRSEVAALHPPGRQGGFVTAGDALDAVTRTAERGTCDVVEAAERMQEAAWTLREGGADPGLCGELDRRATAIYAACSLHDLTAQRTARMVQGLRDLEARIGAMIRFWGGEPAGPEPPGASVEPAERLDPGRSDREDVVRLGPPSIATDEAPPSDSVGGVAGSGGSAQDPDPARDEAATTRESAATIRLEGFADIDALDPDEKFKRFT